MQHFIRRHTHTGGGRLKNPHIGLGHAQHMRTHTGLKMRANAHPVHIGIAVGHRHQGKPPGQKGERGQGILKQINLHALGQKHIKRWRHQGRVFTMALQGLAQHFLAQKAHVVHLVRPFGLHRFAQRQAAGGIANERGSARCPGRQPGVQCFLGPGNGGPHGPQRVVQVEGYCLDFGNIQHRCGRIRHDLTHVPFRQRTPLSARSGATHCRPFLQPGHA